MCHCEDGWKGAECDIPLGDCQVPDCNQHGQCVRGSCVCNPGWKGGFCDERKLKTCLVITHCGYVLTSNFVARDGKLKLLFSCNKKK